MRERALAAAVDAVAWLPPFMLFMWALFNAAALTSLLPKEEDGDLTGGAVLAMRLVAVATILAYLWILEAAGTSPGKLLFGLSVVRTASWRRPGAISGLVRLIAKLLTLASLGTLLVLVRLDAQRRMPHDILAGTRVLGR